MTSPSPDPSYREILLTRGQVAIVDVEKFEDLNRHNWYAYWNPSTRSFYAARKEGQAVVYMHREILGLKKGDPRLGEHGQRNSLDNRRFVDGEPNLRISNIAQNQHNTVRRRNNTSGFKGVRLHKRSGKYYAQIMSYGGISFWVHATPQKRPPNFIGRQRGSYMANLREQNNRLRAQ